MIAYNGSVPGPALRVREGSELVVDVVNEGDLEATVHWHGLRLENRYDGTHETQAPIPVGGSFSYRISFPDPGVYWYHPHIREDYGQELGQYGNIVVVPAESRLLAARPPRAAPDPRRRPDRGREDRAVQPRGDDVRRHGPLRQRPARRRRDGAVVLRTAGRGGSPLPHEHRQHTRLQRRAARSPAEARRRRQRPRRA